MNIVYFLIKNTKFKKRRILKFLKNELVQVNGITINDKKHELLYGDTIKIEEVELKYSPFKYYMLNKPKQIICSHKETEGYKSALTLIDDKSEDLFMVGRLDVLTEGLLLITNDGKFANELLKIDNKIKKTYLIELARPITSQAINELEQGVMIDKNYITKPALVDKLNDHLITLTISEGKFHQVKQMMHAVDNHLLTLTRIQFGKFKLKDELKVGTYIEVNKKDIF